MCFCCAVILNYFNVGVEKMTIIIRLTLSIILLYFVFIETGWATTLTLFLVLCEIEVRQLKENKLDKSKDS